ncbi:protein kinase, partial [bacterium]|nr:protein kinase [bacterium]
MPPNPKQDRIFLELARRRGALDAKGVEALQAQALREQKTLLEAAVSSPSIPAATADGILSDLERLAFTCKKCGRGDLAEPTDRPGSRELCEACSPAKRPSQRLGKATGATPLEGPRKIEAPSGTSAPGPGAPGSGAASATAATGSASDSQRAPPPPSGSVVKRPTSSLARSSQSFKAIPPASGSASAPSAPASAPSAPAAPAPGAPSGSAAPPEPSLRGATSVAPASSPGPPPPTGRASQRLLERFASSPSSSAGALEPPRRKTFSLSKDSQAGTALPPQAPPPGARAAGEPAEDAVFLTHMTDAPAPSSARTETAAPPDASPGEVFLTQAGGEPEAPKTTDAAPVAEKGPGEGDVFLDEIGGKAVAPSADAPVSPNAPVRGSAKKSAISSRRTGIFAGTLGLADEPARNAADPGAKAPALLLDDVDMAGAVIGGCRIERLLGKGAMARVYVAHDPKLDRKTAIKILDEKLLSKPGFADQFVAEARTLAKLDHPNIVRVHTVDKDPSGAQFIVMELLEGGSVEALWKKSDKRLPIDEAVRIIREAAEGLFHAHRAGLIHRDVKPANLMLTKDKRVKVVDFGLAVPTQGDVFVATGIAGTPVYMAPEQADGLRLDARCDQYSLGVTLYQLLCGRPPFEGKRGVDVLLAHATAPPVPPHELRPDIPPWLEKGLLTMLAKAPSARFPSLGDVVRLFQGQRAPTQELPPPVPARPAVRVDEISGLEKGLAPKAVAPPRWRPALLALAACAAVLVVFFLGPGRVALGSAASRVGGSPVVAKEDRREPAHAVSRHLGPAAIRVEQPHRRAVRGPRKRDKPVGANAG